jgi:hypothetical protein
MAAPALMSQAANARSTTVTPKFRIHDGQVRDSKRKDKATTLARRELRRQKYEPTAAVVRVNANANA